MRDLNRIDPFLQKLGKIWKEECPDWRFTQLIINVFENCDENVWFYEEDTLIEAFEDYFHRDKEKEK